VPEGYQLMAGNVRDLWYVIFGTAVESGAAEDPSAQEVSFWREVHPSWCGR